MTALLVYPTHGNCLEVQKDYLRAGISAAAYPARTTDPLGSVPPNCSNRDADLAERMGFSVMQSVCPFCIAQPECKQSGYLKQIATVNEAQVVLCTHQRAACTGLRELSCRRKYVSIHENPIDSLRPKVEATLSDLIQVQSVLDRMLTDPEFLDWFGSQGSAVGRDDLSRQELAIRRERQFAFTRSLADLVDRLIKEVKAAEKTCGWEGGPAHPKPEGIEATLFFATRIVGTSFSGQPWRFLLATAAGELHSAAIIVDRRCHTGGGQDRSFTHKSVIGFRNNPPHPQSITWFNDATISSFRLQGILGTPVCDYTPHGMLRLQRKAVQIVRDITRRTTAGIFQNVLRGVLLERPRFRRIGMICHSNHIPAIKSFELELRRRIVRVSYFGSGEERSSNDWYRTCDLIIVAGTPRVPPSTIATYLVQVGDVPAACREAEWASMPWDGRTESNETITVYGSGYCDAAWRQAHRELVRAAIVQAIGRGRGILEQGCEVIVLSNEECGLPISDVPLVPINATAAQVLAAVHQLTMENPNRDYIGNSIVKTLDVVRVTGLSEVRTRELLRMLERIGQVRKVGERGGWLPVTPSLDASTLPDSHVVLTPETSVG